MCTCRTDGLVARAARTGPEVARAPREEPEVDSVSPAAAPAGGAASSAQFPVENSDCTSARRGVRKLGPHRASPVPSLRQGKEQPFTIFTILDGDVWPFFSPFSNSPFITDSLGGARYAFSDIIFTLKTFILKIKKLK